MLPEYLETMAKRHSEIWKEEAVKIGYDPDGLAQVPFERYAEVLGKAYAFDEMRRTKQRWRFENELGSN